METRKLSLQEMEATEGGISAWCIASLASMGVAIASATVLTGGLAGLVFFQLGLMGAGAGVVGSCR